jgi:WD40 repeat protein
MAIPTNIKHVRTINRPGITLCIAHAGQDNRVFVGSSDAKVYALDLSQDKPDAVAYDGHTSYVTGVALAGKHVVSGGYDRKLIWREADGGKIVRTVAAHEKWIRAVVASPDGSKVASAADDMVCKLWNAESGELIHDLRGHASDTPHHFPSMLFTCAFSRDGKQLATADKPGHVVVWDVETGKQAAAFESPEHYTWDPRQRRHSIGGVRSLAFSPDGGQLAVGGIAKIGNVDHLDGKALVHVFDWSTGERRFALEHPRHKGLVNALRYTDDGEGLLAAGGAGGGFFFWLDAKKGKPLSDEDAKMHVHGIVCDENFAKVYVAGHNGVTVWEMSA